MDSPKLKPCPACGASVEITGGDSWHNQNEFWIVCKSCHCVRVGDTEKNECIKRWNALPRGHAVTPGAADDGGMTWHDVEQAVRQMGDAVEKATQQIVALVGKLEQSIKPGELESLDIERVSGPFLTKAQIETIVSETARQIREQQEAAR